MPTAFFVRRAAAVATLFVAAFAALASSAHADSFQVTASAAGVQTPGRTTSYYESFDNATLSQGGLTTTFNGSSVTGTYSSSNGGLAVENASVYGGAGGSGKYVAATSNGSYTLTLSQTVNYFGLWDSALDGGNQLSFYNGSTLLYTFSPNSFITLVGSCPSSNSGYCGNPNAPYAGTSNNDDAGEQFAYLNFYDANGGFNKVVFTQTTSGGEFESDNHAVANVTTAPGGLLITPVPEPSASVLMGTGLLGGAGLFGLRRRSNRG